METVLITGASGLVGQHLTPLLQQKGYRVVHLSRSVPEKAGVETFKWDVHKQEIDARAVEQADYIIHLAGAAIADKEWSNERKKEIIGSRVESTHLLFKALLHTPKKLKGFVSASAIGYYGAVFSERIYTETDPAGTDFVAITCKFWEGAAETVAKLGIRVVKIRTGIVLSTQGGALPKMAKPVKFFIGSSLGTGKQYVPWIHIEDLCSIYLKAIEDPSMHGPYNAVAPEGVTNKDFIRSLAKVLHRPLILPPVPAFLINFIFGELAQLVLKGSRVSCQKIENAGYHFKFKTLFSALANLFK